MDRRPVAFIYADARVETETIHEENSELCTKQKTDSGLLVVALAFHFQQRDELLFWIFVR